METLLAIWRDKSRASADVKSIAREHIEELERKASAIHAMTATLKHPVQHCHRDERPDCPIIEEFANPGGEAPSVSINARFGLNGLKTEYGGR
jgi:hypothetical protein